MNLSKKAHLADLRNSIKQAAASGQTERYNTLVALLNCWKQGTGFLDFAHFLEDSTDRDVQYLVADAFAYTKDEEVLTPLMKAAIAPVNEQYSSTLIWPCGKYDCTTHLSFFVDYMLRCIDPGEAMLACVDVIEAMRGPFEPQSLKYNVCRLLIHDNPLVDSSMQLQHEIFRMQAAHALLDKYYTQVDTKWAANSADKP